jgi:hypothetical protein
MSHGKGIVNNELATMWKIAIVAYFNKLSCHISNVTEDQLEQFIFEAKINSRNS